MSKTPAETYRVVAVRGNGERVIISEHVDRAVAEKVVKLIQNASGYSEVRIEHDGQAERH